MFRLVGWLVIGRFHLFEAPGTFTCEVWCMILGVVWEGVQKICSEALCKPLMTGYSSLHYFSYAECSNNSF